MLHTKGREIMDYKSVTATWKWAGLRDQLPSALVTGPVAFRLAWDS